MGTIPLNPPPLTNRLLFT
ncbi:hypothetical protein ID866_12424 [Astraeus odoratus]|nr:hypothetical protein ID866_12424 [Astraeus odoratus]